MDEFSYLVLYKGIDMEHNFRLFRLKTPKVEYWESNTQLFSQYDTDGERID